MAPKPQPPEQSATALTKEQTEDLRTLFGALDRDGSGQVSSAELLPALQTVQASATMEDAKAMLAEVDIDVSGTVSWDEFLAVMEKKLSETVRPCSCANALRSHPPICAAPPPDDRGAHV